MSQKKIDDVVLEINFNDGRVYFAHKSFVEKWNKLIAPYIMATNGKVFSELEKKNEDEI